MQKLVRYNNTVEYTAGIENMAVDALRRHPEYIGTNAEFVYFVD